MIDFQNGSIFKLKPIAAEAGAQQVSEILLPNEKVIFAYQAIRDSVIFTDKRIIAVNAQGITGKKIDYSSLPYARIQVFSVETAGHFDLDSEMELWFSGLGKVRFEFSGKIDIRALCRFIGEKTL